MTPLLTPLIAFALHVFCNHFFRVRSQQRLAMVLSVLAAIWVLALSWGSFFENLWTLVTSMGFGYAYFHFFNISETAIRPQILSRLLKNPDPSKVGLDYNDQGRVEERLQRLEAFGAIEKVEGEYALKPSLMGLVARLFCHPFLRRLFDYQTQL